jgi:parallel beta-helix repeat protein
MEACLISKRSPATVAREWVFLAALLAVAAARAASLSVPSDDHKTIAHAMAHAVKGDTIRVEKGTYAETFTVSPGVTIMSAAKERFGARIVGGGAEKVVSLSNSSMIEGFEISGGTIGVYSAGRGNAVVRCLIQGNSQTGLVCVGHLPRLEDNVIVYNDGSGVQGWDVRSTISAVSHNTIAYNKNHGIALGGNSNLQLDNNIIAFNEKMGLRVDPTVKVTLKRNCFYGNTEVFESFPSENVSFDPMFTAARKLDFTLSRDSRLRNMGTDNQDIGARIND